MWPAPWRQFNSTAMMVETHQLAVECSRQLVNHTHTAVANDLDTAVGIVNNSVGQLCAAPLVRVALMGGDLPSPFPFLSNLFPFG